MIQRLTAVAALLFLAASPAGAQQNINDAPARPDPETAVAAYIGFIVRGSVLKLNPRQGKTRDGLDSIPWPPALAAETAKAAGADLVAFEDVVVCRARVPADGFVFGLDLCRMAPPTARYLTITPARIVGDSAEVHVTEWSSPGGTRVGIAALKYTVARSANVWRVVSRMVTAMT